MGITLIVDEKFVTTAKALFNEFGVKVVSGHRFLGGFIGDVDSQNSFVSEKVNRWVDCIGRLSWAAEFHPQAAYAALLKSVQFEWSFLQRVVPDCASFFPPVYEVINNQFWPSLFQPGRARIIFITNKVWWFGDPGCCCLC